jgi:hypothetical protein
MKTVPLTVPFDAEKLSALRQYAARREVDVGQELADAVAKLYEKHVPAPVREYIENRPAAETPTRPSRAPRAGQKISTGGGE